MAEQRKRRTTGEESRQRILDAAVEIAAARGYEGTSISEVSKRSGLPASSIYWHFEDKDALIAAVIDRSFEQWLAAATFPAADESSSPGEFARATAVAMAKSLLDSPDFLRLGLMLALERRPEGSSGRDRFIQARAQAIATMQRGFTRMFPELGPDALATLATYAMAGADGLFVAHETSGDAADLVHLFELHAIGVVAVAAHLAQEVPA